MTERRDNGNELDRRIEREINDELDFHVEMRTRENIAAGMEPKEARREALRRMGELDETLRAALVVRRGVEGRRRVRRILEDLLLDLRFAVRSMATAPGPTAVALLALALGIGATTAIFSVVDGVLLQELPYEDPDRIITIRSEALLHGRNTDLFRQRLESVAELGFCTNNSHDLTGVDAPSRVTSMAVSEGFFPVLGVPAAQGRTLVASDHAPDVPPTTVISDRFWRTTLGADAEIVGRPIILDGRPFIVVGVMPPSFTVYPLEPDIWVPVVHVPSYGGYAIARLADGATLDRARVEVEALERQLGVEPLSYVRTPVQTLHDSTIVELAGSGLMLLAGAVALVLLIACANVANLLLARSFGRQREIGVRAALGASRGRLVRQLLTESTLLAAIGGTLGVGLAWWSVPLLVSLIPYYMPRAENVAVDLRVLSFALAASLPTGLVFGLAPAVFAGRLQAVGAMGRDDQRTSASRASRRMLDGLVVAEIALALVLVVGTGLLIRTFLTLRPSAPGFDPRGKLTFGLRPPERRYQDPANLATFYERVLVELRALPDAAAVAAVSVLPFVGYSHIVEAFPEGLDPAADPLRIRYERASVNYFDVMAIPMLRGRSFATDGGDADGGGVAPVVVNQSAARRLWPQDDPLGKRVRLRFFDGERDFLVVGVAADTRREATHTEPSPTVWAPLWPHPADFMTFVVQARGQPQGLAPTVRETIRSIDPDMPVDRVRTMDEILYESLGTQRFFMTLMSAFGGIALFLAATGFYGVMSYSVSRRRRELGVRLALGASPAALLRMVLRQGMVTIAVGVAIGLGGAIVFSRMLEARIYGMQPAGPLTLPGLVALVVAVGLAATYVPARRATRADPLNALREQ